MTWIMIHKKYESSEKSEKLPPGRPTKVDVRVGKAANGQYFSTQMLFHPNVGKAANGQYFSTQMLFHYHLLLYIQLFLRHGLSIYHCAVDKGNYCDLYLGWGETHTHTVSIPTNHQVKVCPVISFTWILSIFQMR